MSGRVSRSTPNTAPSVATSTGVTAVSIPLFATEVFAKPTMKHTWYTVLPTSPSPSSLRNTGRGSGFQPSTPRSSAPMANAAMVKRSDMKARGGSVSIASFTTV